MVTWGKKTIGECAEIIGGGTPSTTVSKYWDGGISWCTPTDITKAKSKYLSTTERTISDKGLKDSGAILLPAGTILLCSRATIGEMCIAAKPISTNQGFKNLVCSSDVDNNFLYYLLQTKIGAMLELAVGSTFLEISKKALASIEIQLPPLPEQRRIAEALSDTDALLAAMEKLIAKKRAIKQGAMQELLTGKRRLPGFEGEWVEQTVSGCLTEIIGGGTPARSNAVFWNGSIPWVTVKDFATFNSRSTQEYISDIGLYNSATHLIPKGTPITATRMGLGQIVVYDVDVTINQDLKALVLNSLTDTKYFVFWFRSKKADFEALGTGSTVKGITLEQLREVPILLPPTKAEQTAIAEILSDMDAEIDALTAKLNKLRNIKQGMMSELLTGRIRLTEQGAEVATGVGSKIFAIQNRALRVAINCPLPLRTPDDCRACGNQECFEAWKEQNKLWPEKYEDHVCHAPFANTRRVPAKSSAPLDKKVSGTSPRPGQPASGSDLFTLSNEVEGQP